jgi:hypothetical protein
VRQVLDELDKKGWLVQSVKELHDNMRTQDSPGAPSEEALQREMRSSDYHVNELIAKDKGKTYLAIMEKLASTLEEYPLLIIGKHRAQDYERAQNPSAHRR